MAPVFSQFQPDGERYRSLNLYLKKLFGEKVYKVTLNGGMTCPNRDGHIGTGGRQRRNQKKAPRTQIYRLFSSVYKHLRSCRSS